MKADDYYNKDYNIDSKEGSTKKLEEEEKDENTSILSESTKMNYEKDPKKGVSEKNCDSSTNRRRRTRT